MVISSAGRPDLNHASLVPSFSPTVDSSQRLHKVSSPGVSFFCKGLTEVKCLCAPLQEEEVCEEEEEEGLALQYQLSIYSLDPANFGEVVQTRPIKAAHCLTAIQFSPASRHILLAYGRYTPPLTLPHPITVHP